MLESGEWDVESDGMPLHAAHLAIAAAGFSASSIVAVGKLGIKMERQERDDLMHVWRYVIWLLGIPDEIFRFDSIDDAMHLKDVGFACEPLPGHRGDHHGARHHQLGPPTSWTSPTRGRRRSGSRPPSSSASRALIGDEIADRLDYPKQSTFGVLALVRAQRRLQMLASRLIPGMPLVRLQQLRRVAPALRLRRQRASATACQTP